MSIAFMGRPIWKQTLQVRLSRIQYILRVEILIYNTGHEGVGKVVGGEHSQFNVYV